MASAINVVIQVAAELARVLGEGFDVEVLETHHRMKKDSPSGTALKLAEVLTQTLGRTSDDLVFARKGWMGARTSKEIGVQALRGGDVVGEHTVFFFGEGERIELTHRATSRDQFAKGALRAASWVVAQRPGLYDMADVLGLKRAG
jgi:4-hydroxy-tetrahydrodipicolinate reductase